MKKNKQPLWMEITTLAAPLILSMTGIVVMQLIDALFLAWYSADAIGAIVPASMGSYFIISPFQATAGFTSTLVAHYIGAGKPQRVYSATWQGIYCAIISGILVFGVGFFANPIFEWVGHAPSIRPLEERFFSIMCWGALPAIAASALSGFLIGRGKTKVLMIIQLSGIVVNALLDYLLIFGKLGFASLGITGAAFATVIAQLFVAILLLIVFLSSKMDPEVRPWKDRHFNKDLFSRLIRYGFPSGIRFGFEMLAWTGFIFIVGRIGVNELAATNIAFRINGFAFFPVIGIGQAVAILVGQAQGQRDVERSIRVTYAGFLLSEVWMILTASIFVFFPEALFNLFGGEGYSNFEGVLKIGGTLLKLVAVYCLLDAGNIIFSSALQAAGDTKWTMFFSLIAHGLFLSALVIADQLTLGIWVEWVIATTFVMVVALLWYTRFRSDSWHSIRVIEKSTEDLV